MLSGISDTKTDWRSIFYVFLAAALIRGLALAATSDSLSADPDAYRRLAQCLAKHGTFGLETFDAATKVTSSSPTAFRPPLYPWLLSWICDPNGELRNAPVACLHWLLGVATVVGTFVLTLKMLPLADRRLASDDPSVQDQPPLAVTDASKTARLPAIVAAGFVAVDPLLLQSSSLVMTETLAAALVVGGLLLWSQLIEGLSTADKMGTWRSKYSPVLGRAFALGLVLGAAYLCRPTFILWPWMLGAYLLGNGIRLRCRKSVVAAFTMSMVVTLFMTGWTLRNWHHFGRPIWATTHGGYTLLLGNNESFYEFLNTPGPFGQAWDATAFLDRWEMRLSADPRELSFWGQGQPEVSTSGDNHQAPVGEVVDDRLAYESARATISRHPKSFIKACLWRIGRLYSPLPLQSLGRSPTARMAVTGFYGVQFALIVFGFATLRRMLLAPRWAASIALCVALTAVHTFYWTDMRMRVPAIPVLSILAGASVLAKRSD